MLWSYVSEDNADVEEDAPTTTSKERDLALAYIFMPIDGMCKPTVKALQDPSEVWNTLKETFKQSWRLQYVRS